MKGYTLLLRKTTNINKGLYTELIVFQLSWIVLMEHTFIICKWDIQFPKLDAILNRMVQKDDEQKLRFVL